MTILYIWTLVAMAGSTGHYTERDWRWAGEFMSPTACTKAAVQLGLDAKKFRCVSKGGFQ